MNTRLHRWLDRLPEPKRMMLVNAIFCLAVIGPIAIGGMWRLVGLVNGAILLISRMRYNRRPNA